MAKVFFTQPFFMRLASVRKRFEERRCAGIQMLRVADRVHGEAALKERASGLYKMVPLAEAVRLISSLAFRGLVSRSTYLSTRLTLPSSSLR